MEEGGEREDQWRRVGKGKTNGGGWGVEHTEYQCFVEQLLKFFCCILHSSPSILIFYRCTNRASQPPAQTAFQHPQMIRTVHNHLSTDDPGHPQITPILIQY